MTLRMMVVAAAVYIFYFQAKTYHRHYFGLVHCAEEHFRGFGGGGL